MKAVLLGWFLFWNLKGIFPLPTIETIPPSPRNILATGYTGLIVKAQFVKEDFTSYLWTSGVGVVDEITDQFLVHGAGCLPRSSSSETITCSENNGVITSNLTYLQPLTTNLNPSVRNNNRNGNIVVTLPRKTFQDCPQTLKNNVNVQFSSAGYNDPGTFTCSNNGRLFYLNGSQPTSNRTICLYTAEWSGQDNLQCWTAPDPVTMNATNGAFNVVEGNNLTVACQYNDVIPNGRNTAFYLDGNEVGKQQKRSFTLNLLAKDNNKQVSCQVVTPYTEIFKESGRSPNYTINVQYAPFQDNPTSCIWILNQSGSCNVAFMSNPHSEVLALIKKDSGVKVDGGELMTDDAILQTYQFVKSHVTESDNGTYILYLQPSISPYNHTIAFDIYVADMTDPISNNNNNSTLVIPLSLTGAVLAILSVIVGVVCYKRRMGNGKKEKGSDNTTNALEDEAGYIDFNNSSGNTVPATASPSAHYLTPIQPTRRGSDNAINALEDEAGYIDFNNSSGNTVPATASSSAHYLTPIQATNEHSYETIKQKQVTRKQSYHNISAPESVSTELIDGGCATTVVHGRQ